MSSPKHGVTRRRNAALRNRRLIFESLENRIVLSAVRMLDGFDDNTIAASDNGVAGPVDLGFPVDFFGNGHTQLFVNNNGNVTFGSALPEWTPANMNEISAEIIAPFWADVDTQNPLSGLTTYGTDTVDGHTAFGVNWIDVGSFDQHADALNRFQVVLIDRSDIGPGAFDVEFNYDGVLWDSFDTALPITPVSRAGFSDGSGDPGTHYELLGSGLAGAFLDDNLLFGLANNSLNSAEPGRYVFEFRGSTSLDDPLEPNNTLADATVLGSEPAATLRDLSIHDADDVDFFRVTASDTGKLIVNALFDHGGGDLNLQIQDARGNILASSASVDNNERLIIPAVSQEVYFVQVFGLDAATNDYALEIENFAAPLADFVDLPARDQIRVLNDTGVSNRDDITHRTEPEILIEADLSDFAADGITILTPGQAVAMDVPGAAVEVFVNGNSVGYADPIGGTGDTLFRYTFTAGQLPVTTFPADSGGWLHYVKAAVRIIDGQRDVLAAPAAASARTQLSQPLSLRTDTAPPAAPSIQLLPSSDSGIVGDGVTNVNPPALAGVAEVGAIVLVYADSGSGPLLVGQGTVGADETDKIPGDDLGAWEVTIEPLADNTYAITAVVQDVAGNLSESSVPVAVAIDTLGGSGAPQRPTIDLIASSDTGTSNMDNVTIGDPNQGDGIVDVRITSDANTILDIKDGNTVIATIAIGASEQAVVTLDFNILAGITGFPAEGPHPLSAEATDVAGNRSVQSEQLLLAIDTTDPAASVPEMLASSDTGAFLNDRVTGEAQPAFRGSAQANAMVRVFADGVLVGQGVVNSDESDGVPTDGVGIWEITVEPLDDGVYQITTSVEDLAGNMTSSDALQIEIDTIGPNTPQLTLLDDTGHSDADDITTDNTPQVSMTTQDANVLWHEMMFTDYLAFRIYDRFNVDGGAQAEFLLYDSSLDVIVDDVSTPGDGLTRLTQILETLPEQYGALLGDNLPALVTDLGGSVVLADGAHHLKLEVEDRAGNISHDFLLTIHVDTAMPDGSIDLLASSDTGTFDDDNVTSLKQPAFSGLAEANATVRVFADHVVTGVRQLIGQRVVGSDLSDVEMAGETLAGDTVAGDPDDGLGLWEVTVEPLADGVYEIFAEFEDWAGNVRTTDDLRVEIDGAAPNTAMLDLVASSDSGRSDEDDVTNDNSPAVTMTTHDNNLVLHQRMFDDYLKFRIWDRYEGSFNLPEFLLYDSALDTAVDDVSVPGDTLTSLTFVLESLPQQYFALAGINAAVLDIAGTGVLADGVHNLKLEVEDRAGNISYDFLLSVTIDTAAPPVTITGLDLGGSDTGVQGQPSTFTDRITSDTKAGFVGTAEADAIVRMYADGDPISDGIVNGSDTYQGLTITVPPDGNDAFSGGQWNLVGQFDLNDDARFPLDGLRQLGVTAEDLAGNTSGPVFLDFVVDTQGPQVTDVFLTDYPNYDLLDPKPAQDGPTPSVNSLSITIRDLPNRVTGFLTEHPALIGEVAENPGHYRLVGDHNGVIAIDDVQWIPDPTPPVAGDPAFGTIVLSFIAALPDDRYTLILSDSLVDPPGNALDGETNTQQPLENPLFPSGDGQPGGDFVARFTVDTRAELGIWSAGSVYLDINGNFTFDPQNADSANRDIVHTLGYATDYIFAGNFAGPGVDGVFGTDDDRNPLNPNFVGSDAEADGFDKLAAYGNAGTSFRWLIDFTNANHPTTFVGAATVGIPVAGNFDGVAENGDEIGLFTGSNWILDTDRNFSLDNNAPIPTTISGLPFVGDFDGDGNEDFGTLNINQNMFYLDLSSVPGNTVFSLGNGFPFIGPRERPVAGDMDGDGMDDIGLWVPDRSGATPQESGEWYFIVSGGQPLTDRIDTNTATINFTPVPFGNDIFAQFGDDFAIPIVGNFDPPVTSGGSPANQTGDASDESAAAADTTQESPASAVADQAHPWQNSVNAFDVNMDSHVTALDALLVANWFNYSTSGTLTGVPGDDGGAAYYVDINGDNQITPIDALLIVNALKLGEPGSAEGEASPESVVAELQGLSATGVMTTEPATPMVDRDSGTELVQRPQFVGSSSSRQTSPRTVELDLVFAAVEDAFGPQDLGSVIDMLATEIATLDGRTSTLS